MPFGKLRAQRLKHPTSYQASTLNFLFPGHLIHFPMFRRAVRLFPRDVHSRLKAIHNLPLPHNPPPQMPAQGLAQLLAQ